MEGQSCLDLSIAKRKDVSTQLTTTETADKDKQYKNGHQLSTDCQEKIAAFR